MTSSLSTPPVHHWLYLSDWRVLLHAGVESGILVFSSWCCGEGEQGRGEEASKLTLTPHIETGHVDPVLIERYNTPGFVGCLSRVQFNGVAPLKSALRAAAQAKATPTDAQSDRQPAAALPVSYQGKLVESNCGASPLTIPPMSAATDPWHLDNTDAELPFNEERVIPDGVNRDSAIIGGIIAVVIFTILCTLVFLIRYMFRHKGTYHTNEAKGGGESAAESADTAIISTDNPETIEESKKEWFI
ncbi:unnamed protein product [Pleuronectes platessa]|uniref:Neurexin/syndecan/glycophorin C domain-containing protein n=1 Tax=Pleuronectes platessa TaxID=8262 RepID=A0A9N7U6T2_PLEPL|nr:unnamed protein product [Pleuronectes platessa]